MPRTKPSPILPPCAAAVALAFLTLPMFAHAQPAAAPPTADNAADASTTAAPLESIRITGSWLGSGLQNSVKNFAGARTVLQKEAIDATGAADIGAVLRRIPGVQSTDNSGTAGSVISLNIGVRGLTGRYSPRSTVLLDGVPLAVAPYGQPQLSFAPVSLNNIEAIDVVRGGGAVRYGPQNVGGIVNFTTRAIPDAPGFTGDATARLNSFADSGQNRQYSAFLANALDNGFGIALLYSGMDGSEWRAGSDEKVHDLAVKARYKLSSTEELYGKIGYYDVRSRTPGGLTVAQYNADRYQNTRPTDFWDGHRTSTDVGYRNTLSDDEEVEIKAYYNDSTRRSALVNAAKTQLTYQPRTYQVLGVEPRYTRRLRTGTLTHDVTVGYRYMKERGNDASYVTTIATSASTAPARFDNATDAHSVYIDDRIAVGAWRITPGVRYEKIHSDRSDIAAAQQFVTDNRKALPSLNVAYLLTPALTVFGNYTTSFGPVQNIQLNSQSKANPLKPELAKTEELGARWKSSGLSAEFTVFKLNFDNQIAQIPGTTLPTFQNVGATRHKGVETAVDYRFDRGGALAGLNLFANASYTQALQESGATAGLDLPFYSRNTDTVGARYDVAAWSFNLSSTHQSGQYSDNANTELENAVASTGRVPGFRLWNAQAVYKVGKKPGVDVAAGVNNLANKAYYTRNVDGNAGRMAGAPRMVYLQLRAAF